MDVFSRSNAVFHDKIGSIILYHYTNGPKLSVEHYTSGHRRGFSHRFVDRLKHVMCDLHCTFT